jgi:AcrR family transcriptional regulator
MKPGSPSNSTGRVGRRPGRPGPRSGAEKDQTRDAILDVAEQFFSDVGYASTSFRDIAAGASVNPALISYYYGTKRSLFEAVYKRRGKELTDRWARLLDELEALKRPPTIEELLRAYLVPQFQLKYSGPGGKAFARLQARLHCEPDAISFALRRKVYDAVGRRHLAMLERRFPNIDAADMSWRFSFIIGAHLYVSADVERISDLSSGRFDSHDLDEVLQRMLSFFTGGLQAPSTPARSATKESMRTGSKSPKRGKGVKAGAEKIL